MLQALLPRVVEVARLAGAAVMAVYGSDFAVQGKHDDSPVTEADVRAEAIITPALMQLLPGVPVVAEEAVAAGHVPAVAERFWLVDPLDGTREFVQRNGQFTVNIALIEHGAPVLGVVLAPALPSALGKPGGLGRLFAGAHGHGAFVVDEVSKRQHVQRALQARTAPPDGLTVWSSRSHGSELELQQWLHNQQVQVTAHHHIGSSIKFCLLAAGEGDLYPRLSRTMEWDTAAGHAVLLAAGGRVLTLQGATLRYGKPGFENPGFVAWGAS